MQGSARVMRCLSNRRDTLSPVCRATLFDEEVRACVDKGRRSKGMGAGPGQGECKDRGEAKSRGSKGRGQAVRSRGSGAARAR